MKYLCTYADCRVPHERHNECAAKEISACWGWPLEHQHTPKRSRGGRDCWVRLCPGHHGDIDGGARRNGLRIEDALVYGEGDGNISGGEGPHGGNPPTSYIIVDRDTKKILRKIPLEEPDTEGGDSHEALVNSKEALCGPSSPPSVPGTSE